MSGSPQHAGRDSPLVWAGWPVCQGIQAHGEERGQWHLETGRCYWELSRRDWISPCRAIASFRGCSSSLGLCAAGHASKSQIVPQACTKGQHFSTWVQHPRSLSASRGLDNVMAPAKMLQCLDQPLPGLGTSLDEPPASSRLFCASTDTRNKCLHGWDRPTPPPPPRLSHPLVTIPGWY